MLSLNLSAALTAKINAMKMTRILMHKIAIDNRKNMHYNERARVERDKEAKTSTRQIK
jgi:hypothetical protein